MNLTSEEQKFLQGLIKLHRDYYGTLAGNQKCTPANKRMATFIETLHAKLNHAEILDTES